MKMQAVHTTIVTLAMMLFASVWAPPAIAEDLKVGYIDTNKVLKDAPQADLARKKLEDEFNPRDQEIVKLQQKLKELKERQERDAKLMSQEENIKLERKIVSLKRDIKRAKEEFNEDFNLRRNEELAKLHKLISKTTVQVAEDLKYDVILSDNVLYISKRVDITEIVIKQLRELQNGQDRPASAAN
jgi:outer membrane protein